MKTCALCSPDSAPGADDLRVWTVEAAGKVVSVDCIISRDGKDKKRMIRILQSVSNMDRGGIETMLMNYYRHLDRDQFQFDFLVNKEKPGFFDDEVRSLGGRIFMGPGLSPLKYPEYLRYMKTLLDREKEIKVLHAHTAW